MENRNGKRNVPEKPMLPTHPLSEDNLVLKAGVFLGIVPLAALCALSLRAAFTGGDYAALLFVPFTAVPAFVVQMAGVLVGSLRHEPASKTAGRAIIVTGLFVVFAVVLLVRGGFNV